MLADAISEVLPYRPDYVYDRQRIRRPRERREIGISSIRGGGIPGDHEILFAGENEVIELRHSAQSRGVFAAGALRAAAFVPLFPNGYVIDQDLVGALRGVSLRRIIYKQETIENETPPCIRAAFLYSLMMSKVDEKENGPDESLGPLTPCGVFSEMQKRRPSGASRQLPSQGSLGIRIPQTQLQLSGQI
jgi:hypothetical protein